MTDNSKVIDISRLFDTFYAFCPWAKLEVGGDSNEINFRVYVYDMNAFVTFSHFELNRFVKEPIIIRELVRTATDMKTIQDFGIQQ